MADKFYANDANVGFEEYDTLEEAKSAAEEMLQIAMDACDLEWPDWATSISYGRLIEIAKATETNIRDRDSEDDPEGPDYFCDVELVAAPDELALLRAEKAEDREELALLASQLGAVLNRSGINPDRERAERLESAIGSALYQLEHHQDMEFAIQRLHEAIK